MNWRFIPRVTYTNFKAEYPSSGTAFHSWFSVTRFWHGRIINISIKWHQISFDFRRNWIADMFPKRKS
jgi:hypothetical protein